MLMRPPTSAEIIVKNRAPSLRIVAVVIARPHRRRRNGPATPRGSTRTLVEPHAPVVHAVLTHLWAVVGRCGRRAGCFPGHRAAARRTRGRRGAAVGGFQLREDRRRASVADGVADVILARPEVGAVYDEPIRKGGSKRATVSSSRTLEPWSISVMAKQPGTASKLPMARRYFSWCVLASEQPDAARPQAELHGELDRQADVVKRDGLERRQKRGAYRPAAVFRGQRERADALVGQFAAPAEGEFALRGRCRCYPVPGNGRTGAKGCPARVGGRRRVRRRGGGPSRRDRKWDGLTTAGGSSSCAGSLAQGTPGRKFSARRLRTSKYLRIYFPPLACRVRSTLAAVATALRRRVRGTKHGGGLRGGYSRTNLSSNESRPGRQRCGRWCAPGLVRWLGRAFAVPDDFHVTARHENRRLAQRKHHPARGLATFAAITVQSRTKKRPGVRGFIDRGATAIPSLSTGYMMTRGAVAPAGDVRPHHSSQGTDGSAPPLVTMTGNAGPSPCEAESCLQKRNVQAPARWGAR